MEGSSHSRSYSHSRSHSRAQVLAGPTTFSGSNKPPRFPSNGGNGAVFTTSYDDVFGGPPTFAALAPRPEDYSEIFGAFRSSSSSRASSIPVLDLPAVADVDSAGATLLDYSEVFGGFDGVDFAVPYDQLFRPFDAGDCSSDEAWTPVGTESLSDDSDPFAFSEKSPCFSDGNSHHSLDDKQINVSYHKVNPGPSTSPNMTHVAQLNAVPGYTCVVEEAVSLKEMEKERFCSTIGDDIILNVDPSLEKSQKHTNRAMPHMSHDDASLRSFDGDRRSGRAHSATMSNVNSTFASVSDVNLRMEPTDPPPSFKPPPIPAERKGDFSGLKADPRDSGNYGFEAPADGSLPFYDMEVDVSSSAAVSAAAIKGVMERAQVKLQAAKVLMDRKKDSLQNGENPSFKADVKGEEKVQTVHDGCASKDEQFPTASYRAPAKNKVKSSGEDRHSTNASQILPNNSAVVQHVGVTEKLAERKNGKKHSSVLDTAFTEEAGAWKEATQYYEFVNNDTARLAPQWPSNGNGKTAARKQLDSDDEHNSDSADEACAPEENRRRLKATKPVSRQEYYEKMVQVAQEVHNTVNRGHVETEKRLGGVARGNLKQQKGKQEKLETQAPQIEEKKLQESVRKEKDDIRLRNAREKDEINQKEKESSHRDQNDRNRNGAHHSRVQEVVESKEEERRTRGSFQWGRCEERTQETVLGEENEQRENEAFERPRKEKKLAGSPKQTMDNGSWELDYDRSKEAFDVGFGGEVLQKACGSQENDKMQDLRQRKLEDNRHKEACDDVFGGEGRQKTRQTHQRKVEGERSKEALEGIFGEERLQRTSGTQEIGKTKSVQQTYEYENHAAEAVELEGGRKYKEAPGQEKIEKRLDEAKKLVVDCTKSEKSKKHKTRLEKSAKEGHVGSESVQTGEREETCEIRYNTGDSDNQKAMPRSRVNTDQTDGDQAPDRSPEIELSIEDKHLNLPNGVKLNEKDFELDDLTCKQKKPQMEAHDSLVMPTKEDNGDISTVPSDKKSKSETVASADVLIDERLIKSTVSQVGASDRELKRTVQAPETLHTKDSNATSDGVSTGKGHNLNHKNEKVGPSISDLKVLNSKMEREEKDVLGEGQGTYDKLEKVRFTPAEGTNGSNEQLRKKEAAPTALPESKENIQKRSELPAGGKSTGRKEKIIQEEKNKEKERDYEQEQLRKVEEEKEREREREKDRMAVEIAIREARERAFADARDRAERATLERATDEVRQRAMAEARERLEKACQEARERSSTEKATEARLRAERAAVERATAEARQRAFEKTMVERVTLEARGRMQRSVSEKYSSERDVAMTMRQSSMPSISERSEGADGEPAQRCKARLERHRRTVERVANALAEKNMRDLVAQREQAERSRIAETLDTEIKRWSSGKEGNLRALLSTLQYILGHDSGWQPIPLTEVITAAAVKKAYRKATLYVHPDKLQQRGATIQQKYICEKVFDLLKEAWNRFNSEEK